MSGTDTKYRTPGERLNKPSFHETCFPPIRILPANHANGRESENFSLRFIRDHSRNSRAPELLISLFRGSVGKHKPLPFQLWVPAKVNQ